MTDKHKKILQDKIKELGLYEASRLFGLTMAEILNYSKIKITHNYANQVLLELMDAEKITTKYKGFYIQHNGEGAVVWHRSKNTDEFGPTLVETIYCMATPLYNGNSVIPIDFDYYMLEEPSQRTTIFEYELYGECERIIRVDNEFESLQELLEWYEDFYLPQIYNNIVNECLPTIRENHREDILEYVDEYFN